MFKNLVWETKHYMFLKDTISAPRAALATKSGLENHLYKNQIHFFSLIYRKVAIGVMAAQKWIHEETDRNDDVKILKNLRL